jgi:hypothetical protein
LVLLRPYVAVTGHGEALGIITELGDPIILGQVLGHRRELLGPEDPLALEAVQKFQIGFVHDQARGRVFLVFLLQVIDLLPLPSQHLLHLPNGQGGVEDGNEEESEATQPHDQRHALFPFLADFLLAQIPDEIDPVHAAAFEDDHASPLKARETARSKWPGFCPIW